MPKCSTCGVTATPKWYKAKTQCVRCYGIQRKRENPERVLAISRESKRKQRENYPERVKGYVIKSRYGLTVERYKQMVADQNNLCAICHHPNRSLNCPGTLVIDHCHKTGQVRGLLCSNCNRALGYVKESVSILASAISYLKKFSA